MQIITTITQKGQITIPIHLRKKYKLGDYDKVLIKPEKEHLKIMATEDILDLAGSFKPKVKKPILASREQMEKKFQRF